MPQLASLDLLPVWVAPTHLIRTAKLIAEGDQLSILTVLDNGNVQGYVLAGELSLAPEKDRVSTIVHPFTTILDGQISVREAAALVAKNAIPFAPVVSNGVFLGVINAHSLLSALLDEGDPLTGLRWSDYLRDWGSQQLAVGHEICVIAFDIPEFGHFNRRFGYNVGDQLLLAAAAAIEEKLDPSYDIIVRHSGDELLIGTIRDRDRAVALAQSLLTSAVAAIQEAGLGSVALSYGLSGGFRTTHRESTHTAAMLDDLIRLAQRDGAERRERDGAVPMASAVIEFEQKVLPNTPCIISVVQGNEPEPSITVGVRLPEGVGHGRATFLNSGTSGLRDLSSAVANATAHAIERCVPQLRITVDDVSAFDQPDGTRLVSVFGFVETPVERFSITGSARVIANFADSVAEATLQAYLNLNLASIRS